MFVLKTTLIFSQTPNEFKYQAVLRNTDGTIMSDANVSIKVSILKSDLTTSVFEETHNVTTTTQGLISLNIGSKEDLSVVNWNLDEYFLEISINGTIIGTSQLLSVPYALQAKTAESITGVVTETDPIYGASQSANITAIDITNLSNLSGTNTGDQDLSALAAKTALSDSTALVRSEIPDVSGFLSGESDPIYGASVASGITGTDTADWNNKLDSYTETQDLADVLGQSNDGNALQIKNIADPTDAQDVATKAYVEDMLETLGVIVVDIDGNVYTTVRIGSQVWMGENLKTTEYSDGTAIPIEIDNTTWAGLTTGAYCWHGNNESNKDVFGALYNWYAVDNGNLCPAGWHVATEAEWNILRDQLGGQFAAAGALKESGTAHWTTPNTGATNSSGFSALPGMMRKESGEFYIVPGLHSYFWTSDEHSTDPANGIHRRLNHNSAQLYPMDDYGKMSGFSVRCIKD